MKVLYIAAECKPFAKAGGVGDVAGELPPAVSRLGVEIEVVTPWYGQTSCPDCRPSASWRVPFGGREEHIESIETSLNGVTVTFLRNSSYFESNYARGDRPQPFNSAHLFKKDYSRIYVDSEPRIPFVDDALRFSFFSEACLALIERKRPDIVHINDWVLGFLFGRMQMEGLSQKRVLTVHNVGYQGNLGRGLIAGTPLERIANHAQVGELFVDPRPEWRSVNALRLGMELADAVNTVSPTYKQEMTEPEDQGRYFEGGKGLDRVAERLDAQGRLHGILNGFEYGFPPSDDHFTRVLDQKAKAKAALSAGFQNPNGFLFGFVGRAVEQKFRLLTEQLAGKSVLEHILDMPGVNVAVLATGLPEYEAFLSSLKGRPNFDATIAFDKAKAQQISVGSDVFLMPSLFEPCGITQMESLSCATPPLVRWTGGLKDTVRPHTASTGTGFGFDGASRSDVLSNLVASASDAVRLFSTQSDTFHQLQRRGFAERFLWSTAAQRYIKDIYEPLCTKS